MENRIELLGYYGGDLEHAASAWCSTNSELTPEKLNRLGKFLKDLAVQGHHAPYEKSMLHFHIVCDTASHIHLLKHRIGVSLSSESARYKELKDDKFYIPEDWPEELKAPVQYSMKALYKLYHEIVTELVDRGFDRKRAKESARFVLPYANQLNLNVSFNFRSFMHFQKLRNNEHAQKEIREIAQKMLDLVRNTHKFDASLAAFGY